jgi:serine/threonine-protein kinase
MHAGRLVAGKYRIERLVASGSMGEVYEAHHVGIGKRVALKLMPPVFASSAERIARFRREARAAGMLESDYIVQVFDAGCDTELGLYLVTELLVGEDLRDRLGRVRRLDPATVAGIGYEVARGLSRAHAAGVIHRDLKPENVFLAERDDGVQVAKILDFGISKRMIDGSGGDDCGYDDEGDCVTDVGITLGTPEYMSPEQAMGLPDLDGRSDVWSLAATLYEALCGHPPHPGGGSPVDVMFRTVNRDVPPLSTVAPWVPQELSATLDAALQRDRDCRTPDAATLARALDLAMPEARWSLSGVHPVFSAAALAPPTMRSPPPVGCDAYEEAPPSSGGSVQFFQRDGRGTPVRAFGTERLPPVSRSPMRPAS